MSNQPNEWLSVSQMEQKTNIPTVTIRRYIKQHGHHLRIKKRGKIYLMASESLPVLKIIREQYDKGKQMEDVEDVLREMNLPVTITIEDDENDNNVMNVGEVLTQLQKDMNEQKQFNQSLLEVIEQQHDYIKNRLEERDRLLIETMNQMLESRKEIASSQEEIKPKGFFARLFNK